MLGQSVRSVCWVSFSLNVKDKKCHHLPSELFLHENHDLAIARSSTYCADPGLRVAFKCLNV